MAASSFLARAQRLFRSALRLACPRCGQRTLFAGWFEMHPTCSGCDLTFEREPGYFVGAIYINYAATAVLTIGGFLILDSWTDISLEAQLMLWGIVGVGFPLLFFRYSKSLWLAIDHLFSPTEPELRLLHPPRP